MPRRSKRAAIKAHTRSGGNASTHTDRLKRKLGVWTWVGKPSHDNMHVGIGCGHIVLDGDPAPLPQRRTAPQFSADICCGQMATWIKMPLVMEVGLYPGDFVLNGDPAPLSKKGAETPPKEFGPCLLWPNSWMD